MFHNLPFPIFVILGIGLSLLMLYYAVVYTKKRKLAPSLMTWTLFLLVIITALQRCVEERCPQTQFSRIVTVIQVACTVFSFLFIEGIAIVRYRQGKVPPEKKKLFWLGMGCFIFVLVVAAIIIIDIWTR